MCFWRLIEPIPTGQVRTVMAQTVKSSDFVLGSSCAGLYFCLLVVAMKGVVSIDPLVITVGPDQLKYGTQPEGAMISRREDRVCSLQVLSLESRPLWERWIAGIAGFDEILCLKRILKIFK
jgi:hypothetical protein